MILVTVTALALLAFAIVLLAGVWERRERPDHARIDELEKELGMGPPYSSEFPKHKPSPKERSW